MSLHHYVELFALLIAIIFYKDLSRHTAFKYFIPFLAITSIIEITSIGKDRPSKNLIYNFFLVGEFFFYSFLFYNNLQFLKLKKVIFYFFPCFVAYFIINILFVYGLHEYHSYTSILSSFFIVIYICMFFYETILPQNSQIKLFLQPFFWVSVGLLFFNLGSVIMFAMLNFLSSNDLQNKGVVVFKTIIMSLNLILYGSFSIAFILCRNNKKMYSSPS